MAIFLVCSMTNSSPVVNASPCTIVQLNSDYPSTANPGDTVEVTTNMSIACAQWRSYYTGRTDLMDAKSKSLLSASPFDIGFLPFVNVSVANSATVPQVNGPWTLGLIVYIFEDGDMLDSISSSFTIQVGATSVSTSQVTSTRATTVASTATSAASLPSTATSQPTLVPQSPASSMMIEPTSAVFGALVVALCVVVAALVLGARKRNA